MSRVKLTKPQKTLTAIIESEGAKILSYERGGAHLKCDYTFDGTHVFTQFLPYGQGSIDQRWSRNFRSSVRKNKPTN
jgi:hypothetical protein